MSGNIKNIAIVASSTMGSRLLGFLRDILIFSFFGIGWLNSAFIIAFTIPNLLRRLLGEGALTSALVPVLSGEFERGDSKAGYAVLNKVISRLLLLLFGLVLLGMLILWCVGQVPGLEPRWQKGCELGIVMMPYMLLICVSAVFAAALNVLRRFAIAALSPVWLNFCMIISLGGFGYMLGRGHPEKQIYYLCAGVLIGGAFQMMVPAIALYRQGWKPVFDLGSSPALSEMTKLFIPGALGAAIFQINIVASRLFAFSLNDSAVSVLYLANRLVELPLGVFAVAVTTVIFPRIASLIAKEDMSGVRKTYAEGLRLILAVTLPAALGLIILREPILGLSFQWGAFDQKSLALTSPVLLIFGAGLPFYALATYLTRGFHALKDTKTPLRIAAISFLSNILLSVFLMYFHGTNGLAIANVLSVILQAYLLHSNLIRREKSFAKLNIMRSLCKICVACLLMTAFSFFAWEYISANFAGLKLAYAVAVFVIIPASVIIYFSILWILRFEGRDTVKEMLLGIIRSKNKAS